MIGIVDMKLIMFIQGDSTQKSVPDINTEQLLCRKNGDTFPLNRRDSGAAQGTDRVKFAVQAN
jgi:hypothetical protein